MRVSVIIPTYGRDGYLKRALNSLVCQEIKDFEVVVVDDNVNTDFTKKVIDIVENFISDLNIVYLKTAGKTGSANARNEGIKIATGKYITFLDDDDLYLPYKIKQQLEHLENTKSNVSICNLILINSDLKIVEYRSHKEILNTKDNNEIMQYHLTYHLTGTSSLMVDKKSLVQIGLFNAMDIGDEFYLVYNLIKNGCLIEYQNMNGVICNIHEDSQGLSTSMDKLNGIKKLEEFKQENIKYLSKYDKKVIKIRSYITQIVFKLRNKKFDHKLIALLIKISFSPFITYMLYKKYTNKNEDFLKELFSKYKEMIIYK